MGAAQSTATLEPARPCLIVWCPSTEKMERGTPLQFRSNELEELMKKNDSLRDMPFFVVCITGEFRSGKSFLLNLMQTYLKYYMSKNTDRGWERQKGVNIEGGKWAQKVESVTQGIWMWDTGFVINGVVILLVDCQGTGDSLRSSPKLDNLILYLATEMANVNILNLRGVLQSTDLERIDMCQHFTDSGIEGPLFKSTLMYLIRNWSNDSNFGRRESLFQNIADNAKSSVVKRFAVGIKNMFRNVDTYVLPGPGDKILAGSDGQGLKIEDVDNQFLRTAKELFHYLFVELPTSQGKLFSGSEMLERFEALEARTVKIGQTPIMSSREYLVDSLISKAFDEAQDFYNEQMEETLSKVRRHSDKGEVAMRISDIMDAAIHKFQTNECVVNYPESAQRARFMDILTYKKELTDQRTQFICNVQALCTQEADDGEKVKEMERMFGELTTTFTKRQNALSSS